MRTLCISPAGDRPGVILAGQGSDELWFLNVDDARSYAEYCLRLTGGRTELRDKRGNLTDWFDVPAANQDGVRFLI
ncbi:MAG: hypothetical protein JOY92_10100 [Verrucomicrobia bacterium]|nr:hypothetical protein [Verrucomicrobiota bacterium]